MSSVSQIRILTINKGEEVIIRVNSDKHVTLEFPCGILTVIEQHGALYTRMSVQPALVDESDAETEVEVDDDVETQAMDEEVVPQTPPPLTPEIVRMFAGGGFDQVNHKHLSRLEMEDIAALQLDLHDDFEAGETQIDI